MPFYAPSGVSIGDAIGSGTPGSILYIDASGNLAEDNGNLHYDDQNTRVGIGTDSPTQNLDIHVAGAAGLKVRSSDDNAIIFIDRFSTSDYAAHSFFTDGSAKWSFGMDNDATDNFYIGNNLFSTKKYMKFERSSLNVAMPNDNAKLLFGAGEDASIYYDGTDLNIDTQEVGTGNLVINNGYLQVDRMLTPLYSITKSASFNVSADYNAHYHVEMDATDVTATLPATSGNDGLRVTFSVDTTTAAGGVLTIATNQAADKIIDAPSRVDEIKMEANGTMVSLVCNGTHWMIDSKYALSTVIDTKSTGDVPMKLRSEQTGVTPTTSNLHLNIFNGKSGGVAHLAWVDSSGVQATLRGGSIMNFHINNGSQGFQWYGSLNTSSPWMQLKDRKLYIGGNAGAVADARIEIAAGTTSVPLMHLHPGSLLTTPTEGAVEFSGTLCFTPASDRRSAQLADGVVISDSTVADTTTETTIFTESISANEFYKGAKWHAYLSGYYSTTNATDTFTFRLKIGGTTILSAQSTAENVTDGFWRGEFFFTVRTIGATGTVQASFEGVFNGNIHNTANTSTDTIDTTSSDDITATVQWDAADPGNTITLTQGHANTFGEKEP